MHFNYQLLVVFSARDTKSNAKNREVVFLRTYCKYFENFNQTPHLYFGADKQT